jgi:hypothetical protein
MATVAVIVGAAIVNAIAFTAGNALYDKYGRSDGSEERIRHDKAIEDLQKSSTEWNQKRLDVLDFINDRIRGRNDARNTFDDVDKALDFYNETHPDAKIEIPRKPILKDFYHASDEHNYYEIFIALVGGCVTGYITSKLV